MIDTTRRRDIGYTIISRCEISLRNLIVTKLNNLFADFTDGIPSGVLEKVKERTNNSEFKHFEEFIENTDFPDLKEICIYKGLYRYYFSSHIISQNEFIEMMDLLYKIRCKIAHVKGLFSIIDTDELFENVREIAHAMDEYGNELLIFLGKLEDPVRNGFFIRFCQDFIANLANKIIEQP